MFAKITDGKLELLPQFETLDDLKKQFKESYENAIENCKTAIEAAKKTIKESADAKPSDDDAEALNKLKLARAEFELFKQNKLLGVLEKDGLKYEDIFEIELVKINVKREA